MGMQNCRTVYGETLVELGKENERIVVLEADLGKTTMTKFFEKEFPGRFFEMGIGEQNMISTAAGLALSGKIAFANSFAVFATGRPYDQIRVSCIGELNVKIVGSSCGLSDFGDGATHQGIEDVAIMRALPNMTVLSPADGIETRKMTRAAAEHEGPVYMRILRNDVPDVTDEKQEFKIGKPSMIREGSDITVFAHGYMIYKALKAAETLEKEGVSLRIVNVSTLKPIDEKEIKKLASGVKGVVTVEEHTIIGGLASAIAFILRGTATPIEAVAVQDCFGQSALNYEQLLEHYGLTDTAIVKAVKKVLG
ncbi:MAG: transketolase C-terminal domain-containing protein [Phycisphaerae bacterium]|nr:transketolase C-terminal domain-containing protein [Phycisphaerae bacterium]MDD5381157.1 transketolase C-terminal domain-containing protein [Phycisphaerae bacterium]